MFVRPDAESLAELAADELNELARQARAEINVLTARHDAFTAGVGDELTADERARFAELLDGEEAVLAQRDALTAAAEGAASQMDELLARNAARTAPAEAPAAPEAPADEAPAGTSPTDDASAPETPADPAPDPVDPSLMQGLGDPEAPAAVAAAGQPAGPQWHMVPDSPGYVAGPVGFAEIAAGIDSVRPGSRGSRRPTGTKGSFSTQRIASVRRPDVPVIDDPHALVAEIERVTSQINGGSFRGQAITASALTAAGGWCAPSEQLYDFCDVPDPVDLISLPEITVRRGGVRWPREPDVAALLADFAFQFFFSEPELEAEDASGNPTAVKECISIPCADEFDELRLAAIGYCVEAGILQDQGWPELTEWFLKTFAAAHLRGVSWRTIRDMVNGSTPVTIAPATIGVGATTNFLNGLALQATNLRLHKGIARNATIEGVAPSWTAEVLRADLALQEGLDNKAVTDAMVDSWLNSRHISLQYVADWQSRGAGQPGNLATTQWPAQVNVLLYPAGTWFRAMQPVIELGVMYPKEQLQVNRYTRFFTEDAIAVGKRCNVSLNVTIPLCVNGGIGERIEISCPAPATTTSYTLANTATSGQYKLKTANGGTTADIATNATNANIVAALAAVDDGHSAADFTVTGTAPAQTVVIPSDLGALTVVAGTTPAAGGTVTVTPA